jgi:transcriptional regulator with XRE-family HTH domain
MEKSIHSTQYAAFLKVLRHTRRRAGLTQIQLAKKIDETQTFVSKCERGERRIDVVELRTFCQAFGVPLRQFVTLFEKAIGPSPSKRVRH